MRRHVRAWLKRRGVLRYGSPSLELQAYGAEVSRHLRACLASGLTRHRAPLADLRRDGIEPTRAFCQIVSPAECCPGCVPVRYALIGARHRSDRV